MVNRRVLRFAMFGLLTLALSCHVAKAQTDEADVDTIYRYPEPMAASDYVDGAIFSFVQGTDPEVLVLIEAVAGDSNEVRWQYPVARISMLPTELTHRGELVWQTQWAIQSRTTTYFVFKNPVR